MRADFNGLFGDLLCLSHGDACAAEDGAVVELRAGLVLTAYEEDADERGRRDDLVAHGVVEPAPEWLQAHGSKWVLRLDGRGIRHESESGAGPPPARD